MLFSPEWVFMSRVLEQYSHCKLQGWHKVFHNKFDERWPPTEHAEDTEADCWENLPQMARIHHQWVQQSLLHQTTATPPTECTERTEPSCRERTPTDDTDEHRWLGCAVLPQNSQNTQNWAAWVWQGCHTILICAHLCHLWEALLCQKFPCIPCVLWESLSSHGFLLRRVWHLAIPTPPAMGYYPPKYAEFTEPPAGKSLPRISQIYTDG